MKERVIRTALQALSAGLAVVAAAIGAALAQGRTPARAELVVAAWAGVQVVLTTLASALSYKIVPPSDSLEYQEVP